MTIFTTASLLLFQLYGDLTLLNVLTDQLIQVFLLLLLLLQFLINLLQLGQAVLLPLDLVLRSHENLLQVILATHLHLKVERFLDNRVIIITSAFEDFASDRVVSVFQLVNRAILYNLLRCGLDLSPPAISS